MLERHPVTIRSTGIARLSFYESRGYELEAKDAELNEGLNCVRLRLAMSADLFPSIAEHGTEIRSRKMRAISTCKLGAGDAACDSGQRDKSQDDALTSVGFLAGIVIAATPITTQVRPIHAVEVRVSPRNTTPSATPIGTRK
jgi:hypothetical protein